MPSISKAGASSCSPCPAGKFQLSPQKMQCIACLAGWKCPRRDSRPVLCSVGRYSRTASMVCRMCPLGKFQAGVSLSSACGLCPQNKYSTAIRSGCTACPTGQVVSPTRDHCTFHLTACSPRPPILHATMESVGPLGLPLIGSRAQYRCYPGFELSWPQMFASCQPNAHWDDEFDDPPVCNVIRTSAPVPAKRHVQTRKTCKKPPAMEHSTLLSLSTGLALGSRASYVCAKGFELAAPKMLSRAVGDWAQAPQFDKTSSTTFALNCLSTLQWSDQRFKGCMQVVPKPRIPGFPGLDTDSSVKVDAGLIPAKLQASGHAIAKKHGFFSYLFGLGLKPAEADTAASASSASAKSFSALHPT
jgi:hypothetical protein